MRLLGGSASSLPEFRETLRNATQGSAARGEAGARGQGWMSPQRTQLNLPDSPSSSVTLPPGQAQAVRWEKSRALALSQLPPQEETPKQPSAPSVNLHY